MGRPPLGKRAMTSAEKQRRYLDRLREAAASTAVARLESENAALRKKVATQQRLLRRRRHDGDES
jgi:hypothetical protein